MIFWITKVNCTNFFMINLYSNFKYITQVGKVLNASCSQNYNMIILIINIGLNQQTSLKLRNHLGERQKRTAKGM